jgi:hypothetical protein
MKVAKVICCYFGPRRTTHNTPTNLYDYLHRNMKNEMTIDNGIETDIILVNNDCGDEVKNQYISNYHGKKTKNGIIRTLYRPNLKGSFGAYYQAFSTYHKNYDYFFFVEDDIIIYKERYMRQFVDFLDSDPDLGFVSLAPIAGGIIHSGGGCGLTSTEKFMEANSFYHIDKFLTPTNIPVSYGELEGYEVDFTNRFVRAGMRIENHPDYSALCDNYIKHYGQAKFQGTMNKEHIYQVGE